VALAVGQLGLSSVFSQSRLALPTKTGLDSDLEGFVLWPISRCFGTETLKQAASILIDILVRPDRLLIGFNRARRRLRPAGYMVERTQSVGLLSQCL